MWKLLNYDGLSFFVIVICHFRCSWKYPELFSIHRTPKLALARIDYCCRFVVCIQNIVIDKRFRIRKSYFTSPSSSIARSLSLYSNPICGESEWPIITTVNHIYISICICRIECCSTTCTSTLYEGKVSCKFIPETKILIHINILLVRYCGAASKPKTSIDMF